MLCSVRGAITVARNDADEIQKAVAELVAAIMSQNRVWTGDLVAVFFTVTPDLTAMNPATAVRKVHADWKQVPLLCSQEMVVDGMMPRCIRVLIQWNLGANEENRPVTPVYLGEAKQLRPDL